jgi:hypothetical protein
MQHPVKTIRTIVKSIDSVSNIEIVILVLSMQYARMEISTARVDMLELMIIAEKILN